MSGLQRLQGRHALLTGAGGGIGLAVTEAFLAEGARCTAVDLSAQPSAGLAELLARHPERLAYASADVTRVETLGALVDGAEALRRCSNPTKACTSACSTSTSRACSS